ncbi:sialate O-acetylesterase [uncultured Bacteroides sp.]|uniref:sialate O-acetylesterase n=1 Tax=uncultured Bacteroides sp. TaxID=162156 RepID=UPI002AA87332|nr:sialate O-acetylesterase [uncultured Bacteroides sp.]
MKKKITLFMVTTLLLCYSCIKPIKEGDKIITVPVYGQSLALGEEANLVTDFDGLEEKYNHRIRTENLDENFGYFSNTIFKQQVKHWVHDHRRTFEVSCYGMAEYIVSEWKETPSDNNLIFCTFPEGQGSSGIDAFEKGTSSYKKLMKEIRNAYDVAKDNGCAFIVPAFCWLQGENDLVWNTGSDYKRKLIRLRNDFEKEVKEITHQKEDVKCILYQTSCLSISEDTFKMNEYDCRQTIVPQAQMELVRDDKYFVASGPTYPYSTEREYVHLDGVSQKKMGYLEGISLSKLLKNKKHSGLIPKQTIVHNDTIIISFNIPCPPIVLDTIEVAKVNGYGFSVITPNNQNILKNVLLRNDQIYLVCSETPRKAKVRYAVNGTYWKCGNKQGSRGNLRDSQGDFYKCNIKNKTYRIDNWCYMFDCICSDQ